MTPQFVDLNANGINDMVMATFEGTAFLVEGTPDGYKPPQHILDSADSMVRISFYWDLEANEYQSVDRSTENEETDEGRHMTSIALVDWDEDGDLDLILGAYEGALYLCMNEGSAQTPKFSTTNLQLKADGQHALIEGGLATPRVCDWNGDGLFDILCGGSKGAVTWYRNVGKKGAPEFAASETLIPKMTGQVKGIDDPNGYLAGLIVPEKDGLPTCPGTGLHIETVDYDGDGDLDLLVGAQSYCVAKPRELNAEEKTELEELKARQAELQAKMDDMLKDVDPEKISEVYESEEFEKLNEELYPMYRRQEELVPGPSDFNFIWLYRNNSNATETTAQQPKPEMRTNILPVDPKPSGNTDRKLTVSAAFVPEFVAVGDEVTLSITVQVPQGYHIYGSQNPLTPTSVEISDAGGLSETIDVTVPSGKAVNHGGVPGFWLQETVTIEKKLVVPGGFTGGTLSGQVNFTLCNESLCDPPASKKFSATLKVR